MSDSIINVENLGKKYVLGHQKAERYTALRDVMAEQGRSLARRVRQPFGNGTAETNNTREEFWALKDVSFEVKQGDRVGIIGRNGAGKSTLLKVLSRITEPTTGRVRIKGRVASLLEVGTGFHPELTGRENVYLNGAILGMGKAEIKRKFDEIVAFAEVEKFLDTPVKRYSSGMYVRLAFAVASNLETDVLIVDEVLAVGDAAFQKKCLGKMNDVTKDGRTVLFVSHNMAAVESLCNKAIWLQGGRVFEKGQAETMVSKYLQGAYSSLTSQVWNDKNTAPGNESVRLHRVSIRPENPSDVEEITVRTPLIMEFEYWNLQPDSCLNLSLHVFNEQGIMVFNAIPFQEPNWQGRPFPAGLFRTSCYIPGDLLNDGTHQVQLLVVKDLGTLLYSHDDVLVFDVRDDISIRGDWHGKWSGAVRPNLKWNTELITSIDGDIHEYR